MCAAWASCAEPFDRVSCGASGVGSKKIGAVLESPSLLTVFSSLSSPCTRMPDLAPAPQVLGSLLDTSSWSISPAEYCSMRNLQN